MANKTSQHILNTSANLLGFCLFVITALHLSDNREASLIDEFTAIIAIFLAVSSILSFISLRSENVKLERRLETIADYLFMVALIGIIFVILVIALQFMP